MGLRQARALGSIIWALVNKSCLWIIIIILKLTCHLLNSLHLIPSNVNQFLALFLKWVGFKNQVTR